MKNDVNGKISRIEMRRDQAKNFANGKIPKNKASLLDYNEKCNRKPKRKHVEYRLKKANSAKRRMNLEKDNFTENQQTCIVPSSNSVLRFCFFQT